MIISPVVATVPPGNPPRRTLIIRPRQKGKPEYAVMDENGEKTVHPSLATAWRALDTVA